MRERSTLARKSSGIADFTNKSQRRSATQLPAPMTNATGHSMISMAAILLIGTIVSIAWAPETKSLGLVEASDPNLDSVVSLNEDVKRVGIGR